MTPIKLVECTPQHAEIIATLHAALLDRGWSADSIASLLRLPGSIGLIATDTASAAPQGFVLCLAAGDALDIAAIATVSSARRSGIARRLLDEVQRRASAAGIARILLEVSERNRPAFELYRSLGFGLLARRAGYYRDAATGEAVDALILEKHLAAGGEHSG
jgi:ribosomal protein S18 acetylase RimI-like enzyme